MFIVTIEKCEQVDGRGAVVVSRGIIRAPGEGVHTKYDYEMTLCMPDGKEIECGMRGWRVEGRSPWYLVFLCLRGLYWRSS